MRGGGGQKMSVFVHAQGIKTIHAGGGGQKWQNSVHVVVECPLKVHSFLKQVMHDIFLHQLNVLVQDRANTTKKEWTLQRCR